ncbi:hypothetical protein QCF77_gp71 [Escherichia phage vB_EcoS-Ro145c2YLVW]|uniref:hypothetical protein n=1 Tax=Escherichia phage vB_EcoS-Ro145c2YLVW TaxID=2144178 RepID=UPI001019A0DA|nr:hypothetical protein QCF77_gp71 [Escherichia phage vB_EcoS-Ro145c2YLVW]AUX83716.1 hypothetical protein vBEcoSRo145clw_00041 [Escherichia phage vB_EcoS-Ro145clw]AVZ45555.1 hypothetical protein Ro145c2YLVW_00071 [Escherichia phage vB_EcoS-Ro145c2YLVW]
MEELICIESEPDVQGWFVKGNKYSSGVYYDGRRYVLDEDGDEWDLEDAVGGTLTISFFNAVAASFTTASNHDASADDSEGGCRE